MRYYTNDKLHMLSTEIDYMNEHGISIIFEYYYDTKTI